MNEGRNIKMDHPKPTAAEALKDFRNWLQAQQRLPSLHELHRELYRRECATKGQGQ